LKFIFILFYSYFAYAQSYVTYDYGSGVLKSYGKYDDLANDLKPKKGELLVVNFWATWCEPCVEELPFFNQMMKEKSSENIRLVFVSLDFPKQIEKRLLPFLKNNYLAGENFHLADNRQNEWIDKVSKSWSGAIPATLFLTTETNNFHEGELTFQELIKLTNLYKL
jgi:thiol-disulfide isomerase/thioredoxin